VKGNSGDENQCEPCDIFLETGYIWRVEFDFEHKWTCSTIFTQQLQLKRNVTVTAANQ